MKDLKPGMRVRVLAGVHAGYQFNVTEVAPTGEVLGHAVHPDIRVWPSDLEVVEPQALPIIPMAHGRSIAENNAERDLIDADVARALNEGEDVYRVEVLGQDPVSTPEVTDAEIRRLQSMLRGKAEARIETHDDRFLANECDIAIGTQRTTDERRRGARVRVAQHIDARKRDGRW